MSINKIILIILFFSFFIYLTNNCSKEKTEFDMINETLERIAENVEKKNTDYIMLYFSETYSDDKKRNKNDIESLVERYIKRYRGIIVNILEVKSIYIKPENALIETEIALSSGIARILRKVTNIANRYYKFTVELTKENSIWMIKSSKWQYISENVLSIESKDLLKHLE